MRFSGVIYVNVIARRHVGGILNVNVECGYLKFSYSKVIHRKCIPTDVLLHTQQFEKIRSFTTYDTSVR